jgi:ferritin-like protein
MLAVSSHRQHTQQDGQQQYQSQQQLPLDVELQQLRAVLLQEQQFASTLKQQLTEARQQVKGLEGQLLQERMEKAEVEEKQQALLLAAEANAKRLVEASKKVSMR